MNGELAEREREILDTWPKFDDGAYVWFGDGVKTHNGIAITVEAIEFSLGKVCVKDGEDGDWDTSMYAMHPLKRPAPEVLDADGVEIKVGDTVWDDDGVEMTVMSLVGELPGHVTTHSKNPPATYSINPKRLTHTHPDSWERLEEDAEKNPFDYCKDVGHRLDTCENSEAYKARDIVRRAKKLVGVER